MFRSVVAITLALAVAVALNAKGESTAPSTKSFTYKKTKQADLEIIVHYPPGWKETDKRPGIVFFFGGGWTNGTIKAFEPQATYLASRGMVAARADYRVKSRQGVTPEGMCRGCQECCSVGSAECRQAGHRPRPDRGFWRFSGRAHRRLHGLHTWIGGGRRGYEDFLQAQRLGPLQSGPSVRGLAAADGTDRER